MRRKYKIKRLTAKHMVEFFGFSTKPIRSVIAVLFLGIGIGVAYEEMVGIGTWHSFHSRTDNFNVCFTPPSGCGDLVAGEIARAKKTIYVQAYGLTSEPIIYQLKAANNRGVKVYVLLDGGNLSNNSTIYDDLKNSGIKVAFDKMVGIAHNKIMVLDGVKVVTGSFNFTRAADTRNAENLVLIEDRAIATKYLENWQDRWNKRVIEYDEKKLIVSKLLKDWVLYY